MNNKITQEDIELLRRTSRYISPSSDTFNAVYITPAQQLRNQADELEQKERDIPAFRQLIVRLSRDINKNPQT